MIPAATGEAGPINEMPFFTFLFADLHAHMMALPYTLLALGLSLNVVRDGIRKELRAGGELLTLGLYGAGDRRPVADEHLGFPDLLALAVAALACREYAGAAGWTGRGSGLLPGGRSGGHRRRCCSCRSIRTTPAPTSAPRYGKARARRCGRTC